jgi:hypothetical protein
MKLATLCSVTGLLSVIFLSLLSFTAKSQCTVEGGEIGFDQTICSGENPSLLQSLTAGSGTGSGSSITYRWEFNTNLSTPDWTVIGGATDSTYSSGTLAITTQFRRVTINTTTEDPAVCEAESNVVTIFIIQTPSPGSIAGDATVCAGSTTISNVTPTPSGEQGTITFRWEQSNVNPYNSWTTIAGQSGDGLTISIAETTHFRRSTVYTVNGVACESAPTNTVIKTVNQVTGGIIAENQWVCINVNPNPFTEETPSSGSGSLAYQWRLGNDNINGATGVTYTATKTAEVGVRTYTRITTSTVSGVACSAGSNSLTITVTTPKNTKLNGNWTTSNIWNPQNEPSPTTGTIGCPVNVGHTVTLDRTDATISITDGVYNFGYDGVKTTSTHVIDDSGGAFHRLRLVRTGNDPNKGILNIMSGTTRFEGGADINNTTLYVAPGAKLILGPASCISADFCDEPSEQCKADLQTISANRKVKIQGQDYFGTLLLGNQSRIIVDGELWVYGNVINNNNGTGQFKINGLVNISGSYTANVGNANIYQEFEGNGDILTCGSMITRGSSTIFSTTNDCLQGPCSGQALANCVQFAIGTTAANPPGSSLVENICDLETIPSALIISTINTDEVTYDYEYRWYYSNQSAGNEFVLIDCNDPDDNYECLSDNSLDFIAPLTQTTWHRLQVIQTSKSNPSQTCNSYSRAAQVVVGNWLGELNDNWDDTSNWQFKVGNECVTGSIPSSIKDVVISKGVNFMPKIGDAGVREVRDLLLNPGTSLTLEGGPSINLYGLLTLGEGVNFDADGQDDGAIFTVKSTSEETQGRIGPLPATGGITGNITVERHIPGNTTPRVNRYISMPVSNVTIPGIVNLQAYFGTKLRWYDEEVPGDWGDGWTNLGSNYSTPLISGLGYLAYNQGAIPLVYRGSLDNAKNRGNVALPVFFSGDSPDTDNVTADGWNLVGNPYPSPIVWSNDPTQWPVKQNIEPVAYIADMLNNKWVELEQNSNGTIAMGQAFWVKAINETAALTVSENAKHVSGTATFYRKKSDQYLSLKVVLGKDNNPVDQSYLIMNPEATVGYDAGLDASKFPGIPTRVSLVSEDNHKLHYYNTNTLPEKDIALHLAVVEGGTYSLDVSIIKDHPDFEQLVLKDMYTQTVHTLSSGAYAFSVTENPSTRINRFYLSKNTTWAILPEIKWSVYPNPTTEVLHVEVSSEYDVPVTLINLNGQTVLESVMVSERGIARGSISMKELQAGMYLIKSMVNGKLHLTKVVRL